MPRGTWLFTLLAVLLFPSAIQATSQVCTPPDDPPVFQVSSIHCVNGPCENLLVYAVYDLDQNEERTVSPQQLFLPSSECRLEYIYEVGATMKEDGTLDFNIGQRVNGLRIDLLSVFVNGVEQPFPFEIPYDFSAVYEIRQDGVIIRIVPSIENGKVVSRSYQCISGCTELTIESQRVGSYQEVIRFTRNASAQACDVVVAETNYDSCYEYSYHILVNAILSTGQELGFSSGDEELLIRKYPEPSTAQETSDVTVGPYQLTIETTDETRQNKMSHRRNLILGLLAAGAAVILIARSKKVR